MVGHRARLGIGGFSGEAVGEVADLRQALEFGFEEGALFGGEVGLEPEVNVVKHGA